jgi:hypothetical protein
MEVHDTDNVSIRIGESQMLANNNNFQTTDELSAEERTEGSNQRTFPDKEEKSPFLQLKSG